MANQELIQQALTEIRRHPAQFDMNHFAMKKSCGTAMCFAGWVVHIAGDAIVFEDGRETSEDCVTPDGEFFDISYRARTLLDLSRRDADAIFDATYITDIDELEQHIQDVLNGYDSLEDW